MAYGAWHELPPDLLVHIFDSLPIRAYTRARAVCAALPAASPSLLVRLNCGCFSAWFLTPRSSTVLHHPRAVLLPTRRCVVGWIALYDPGVALMNPLTGKEISFHSFPEQRSPVVFKVVFAPNPTRSEFTAAAITGRDRVTYTVDGNSKWTNVECHRLGRQDDIADVVYHENGNGAGGKKKLLYCLTSRGDVHVLRLPATGCRVRRASFEPLFDKPSTVFYPAVAFAPPSICSSSNAKNLAVCDNRNLYQIWRNDAYDTILKLPGGGKYRVKKNDVFVLKYYPRRRPCWVAVKDLGGYSVFIGKNNTAALRVDGDIDGGGVPGLRGNCVYWIDSSHCRARAKVFDMEAGKSEECFPDKEAIGWYFLGDTQSSSHNSVATPIHQLKKRARHA